MPSGGGGTTVQAPQPSAEERALQAKQLELLEMQQKEYSQLRPLLYEMMGYKENITGTTTQTETPEYLDWKKKYDAIMRNDFSGIAPPADPNQFIDEYGNVVHSPGWVAPNTREGALKAIGVAPTQFTTTGGQVSSIVPMTEDEKLARMNPLQRAQYEIDLQLAAREKSALAGTLPISPALEESLGKQMSSLESYMSTRLGPRWRESTPGIQALTKMSAYHDMIREEARRGAISEGLGQMIAGNQAYTSGATANYGGMMNMTSPYAQLFGQAGQAQEPYRYYNNLAFQANVANAQAASQRSAGLMGGIGSLAGTALLGGLIYGSGGGAASLLPLLPKVAGGGF